ncbi:hypothetical protein CYMTET_12296 [Cymbomonas tetramitiformis]|uniref:Uncharacterized protein n=1 Tax=Cymbomonas tetramitiformis TaxID=36881 RepID=A0AAE0LCK7_9CHLO|nr:hypothetical protein CYMTET_12296 [Cymbomonas tetramitiformis]
MSLDYEATQGVRILETTPLDDGALRVQDENYVPKSNAQLKQFIAEHKREMRALRSNKLFRDFFKTHGGPRRASPTKRLMADDSDHSLVATLDLIRITAEKQGRDQHGVWSAFGHPYQPLGVPVPASKQLPPLNRDDINGIKPETPKIAAPVRTRQEFASSNERASSRQPELTPGEESILCWASKDEEEVRFPKRALSQAAVRQRNAMAGASFVDTDKAKQEEEDEELVAALPAEASQNRLDRENVSRCSSRSQTSGGSTMLPAESSGGRASNKDGRPESEVSLVGGIPGAELEGDVSAATAAGLSDDETDKRPYSSRSALTQRAKEAANNPPPPKPIPVIPHSKSSLGFTSGARSRGAMRSQSALERQAPGDSDESSPVVQWRKEFLNARQSLQDQLSSNLQARRERRSMAMQSPLYTTSVANQLLEDMRVRSGKLSPVPGSMKIDSWRRAETAMHAQDQPKKVDVSEIQAIERFYEKLCHLVERQRVSDPLSLSIVHKVKQLLESGISLQKTLLIRVCEHLRTIAQLGGADNPYVLPILHFIRQSVRCPVEDMEGVLRHMGLGLLLNRQHHTAPKAESKSKLTTQEVSPETQGDKSRFGAKTLDFE